MKRIDQRLARFCLALALVLGAALAVPAPALASQQVYYLHGDHLGTPRVATNAANQVVWRHLPTGEPFGAAAPEEGPDGNGQATVIHLRFPGQYYDRETGLSYNYFRDYDPRTGRYVQSDPIGLDGGVNTYAYAVANPMLYVDPYGLDITVSFNGSAAAGAGHVGIGVNSSSTVGQRPQAGQNPLPIALGRDVPGEISPDPNPEVRIVIPTTPQQDQDIQQCIDERTRQKQNYNLYQNNCAQFVGQCLRAGGLSVPQTLYPRTIFSDLQRRYGGPR